MKPKHGILHDYDLMANAERSAQEHTCVVCGSSPTRFQWSDYSGEAMCSQCGTPYQLKWGSKEQQAEGAYPYLRLREEWVPIVREYHKETGRFTCLGTMLGGPLPGYEAFYRWVESRHPETLKDSE